MQHYIGVVVLLNISRETNHLRDLVQYPKEKFLAFSQPQYVLSMSLNLGCFLASCIYKKFLSKKRVFTLKTGCNVNVRLPDWA